jgi:uncharacterized protein (TIGR01244 family)
MASVPHATVADDAHDKQESTMSEKIWLDIPNCCTPADGLCTGGRPQPRDLQEAQAKGVGTVVNLCPHSEDPGYDEPALVAQLGMSYVNIPIAGAGDLTRENARRLAEALGREQRGILVHCASGNRVGALFALKAHYIDRKSVDESLAEGRAHGLKAMEPAVRQLLGG